MVSDRWKEVIDKAKELAKVASQATKQELRRARDELEVALERATSEIERGRLTLEKRIVEGALADKEPLVLGKEVVTSDGRSLGTVRDMKLDLEGKKIWILVGKTFGEPRNIPVEDIQTIRDKIILSRTEKEVSHEIEET